MTCMRVLGRLLVLPLVLVGMTVAASPAFASCLQMTVAEAGALAEVVVYGTGHKHVTGGWDGDEGTDNVYIVE